MSNKNHPPMNDDDLLKLDDLDKQIEALHTRTHLVDNIAKAKKDKDAQRKDAFSISEEIRDFWPLYLFLIVSALFTGTLGVYMGLSPTVTPENTLRFNDDVAHYVLAFVYCVAFIAVTEFAFAVAKYYFYSREDNNHVQSAMMIIMMAVAGLSVLFTGLAGGTVIASFISFMTDFAHVPSISQKWIVTAIPLLIIVYAFLLTPYFLSSGHAKNVRLLREQKRKNDVDHQLRTQTITQYGSELLQKAELKKYIQLVQEGKLSAAEANAALQAGLTLGQLEKKVGRDIDGIGGVGNETPRTQNTSSNNGNQPQVNLAQFLKVQGVTKAQAQEMLAGQTDPNCMFQIFDMDKFDYISGKNARRLFHELMGNPTHAAPNGRK